MIEKQESGPLCVCGTAAMVAVFSMRVCEALLIWKRSFCFARRCMLLVSNANASQLANMPATLFHVHF